MYRTGRPETKVDLDDLGLDDSETIPQLGAMWRFKDKWTLNFVYSDFSVSSNATNNASFNYDGVTYPLNASLKTDLDITLYIVAVDYAFSQSDTTEWGVGLGLHAIDLAAGIRGSLNDVTLAATDEDFLAPLPNLRIYARHAFSPKLLSSFSIGWLGMNIDNYEGSLLVGSAALDYRVSDRWTIGINYQLTDIDLDVDDGINDDNYDVKLSGLALVAKYSFP